VVLPSITRAQFDKAELHHAIEPQRVICQDDMLGMRHLPMQRAGHPASRPPIVLQPRHPVEHHLPAHAVVHPVGHEVAVALELEFLVGMGGGQ